MKQALYKTGDIVKIKDLATLKQELGNPIRAQCGWYPTMDIYAGGTYVVVDVTESITNGFHYSYKLDGAGRWLFSEDTIELPETEAPYISMGYDELMNCIWQEKGGSV